MTMSLLACARAADTSTQEASIAVEDLFASEARTWAKILEATVKLSGGRIAANESKAMEEACELKGRVLELLEMNNNLLEKAEEFEAHQLADHERLAQQESDKMQLMERLEVLQRKLDVVEGEKATLVKERRGLTKQLVETQNSLRRLYKDNERYKIAQQAINKAARAPTGLLTPRLILPQAQQRSRPQEDAVCGTSKPHTPLRGQSQIAIGSENLPPISNNAGTANNGPAVTALYCEEPKKQQAFHRRCRSSKSVDTRCRSETNVSASFVPTMQKPTEAQQHKARIRKRPGGKKGDSSHSHHIPPPLPPPESLADEDHNLSTDKAATGRNRSGQILATQLATQRVTRSQSRSRSPDIVMTETNPPSQAEEIEPQRNLKRRLSGKHLGQARISTRKGYPVVVGNSHQGEAMEDGQPARLGEPLLSSDSLSASDENDDTSDESPHHQAFVRLAPDRKAKIEIDMATRTTNDRLGTRPPGGRKQFRSFDPAVAAGDKGMARLGEVQTHHVSGTPPEVSEVEVVLEVAGQEENENVHKQSQSKTRRNLLIVGSVKDRPLDAGTASRRESGCITTRSARYPT